MKNFIKAVYFITNFIFENLIELYKNIESYFILLVKLVKISLYFKFREISDSKITVSEEKMSSNRSGQPDRESNNQNDGDKIDECGTGCDDTKIGRNYQR